MRLQLASANGALSGFLGQQRGVEVMEVADASAAFRFSGDAVARADLLRDLIHNGFDVTSFAEGSHQLQDAYFAEVKKNGRGSA
jgi:hypothetical protein